jgi:hypothetical protein
MRIALVILTAFLISASQTISGAQRHSTKIKSDHYIDALVSYPNFGRVYVEDGAADGSVTSPRSPSQPVKDVLDLGPKAIPLLIEHLDDTRLTSALFEGGFTWGKPIRVPVGHVCLDILMHITRQNRHIFDWECGDDGLGACVREGYYFRPDEYYPVGNSGEYIARVGVRFVKANWLKAYRRGWLRISRSSQ